MMKMDDETKKDMVALYYNHIYAGIDQKLIERIYENQCQFYYMMEQIVGEWLVEDEIFGIINLGDVTPEQVRAFKETWKKMGKEHGGSGGGYPGSTVFVRYDYDNNEPPYNPGWTSCMPEEPVKLTWWERVKAWMRK